MTPGLRGAMGGSERTAGKARRTATAQTDPTRIGRLLSFGLDRFHDEFAVRVRTAGGDVQRIGETARTNTNWTEKQRDEDDTLGEVAGRSPAVKQVEAPACGGVRQSHHYLLDSSAATCGMAIRWAGPTFLGWSASTSGSSARAAPQTPRRPNLLARSSHCSAYMQRAMPDRHASSSLPYTATAARNASRNACS